jgi:FkbM family methyltransferase
MHNIKQNGIENIEIYGKALGDCDGSGRLGSGLDGNTGSRSLVWTTDPSKDTGVEIVRADTALAQLNVTRLDLIKLDVEGYERQVLAGLRETLVRDRPMLLFELVGQDVKGGFKSEADLRSALPYDSQLYTLAGGRCAKLLAFDWNAEEAVCIPNENIPVLKTIRPDMFPK